jgi:hypothetical protein
MFGISLSNILFIYENELQQFQIEFSKISTINENNKYAKNILCGAFSIITRFFSILKQISIKFSLFFSG